MVKKFILLEGWSHTLWGVYISNYIHMRSFPSNFRINGHWNLLGRVIGDSRTYRNGISTLVDAPYHDSEQEKCLNEKKATWKSTSNWHEKYQVDGNLPAETSTQFLTNRPTYIFFTSVVDWADMAAKKFLEKWKLLLALRTPGEANFLY